MVLTLLLLPTILCFVGNRDLKNLKEDWLGGH